MKKLFYFLTGLIVIAGITFTFSETGLFKGEFGGHFGGEFGGDSEPTEDYFLRSPASLASLITTNASEAAKYEATAREEMDLSFTSIPLSEEQIGHADTAQIAADSAEIEASEAEETYDRIQPFIDDLSDEVTRINAEIDVIEKEIKDTKEEIEDLEELIEDLEADVILKEEEEAAAELDYRTKKSYFDVCIASDSDLCTVQRVEMDNAWDAWQDIAIPALEAAEGKRNIQVRNIGVQVDKLESLEGELVILQGYPPEVEVAIPTEGELSEAKTAHKDGLAIQTTAEIDRDDARDSADMAASYATDAEAGGDGTSAWIRLNITNQNGAIPRETLDIDNFKLIGGESRTILSVETNDSWHYIDPSGLDTRYHYTIYVIEVYEDSGDGYDKLTLKDLPNGYVNHQIQDRNLKISTDKRKLFPQDIVLIPGYALEITDPLGTILDDATITTKEDLIEGSCTYMPSVELYGCDQKPSESADTIITYTVSHPDYDEDAVANFPSIRTGGNDAQVLVTVALGVDLTDEDGDGLSLTEEEALGTLDTKVDTDGDGLSDWDEVRIHETSPILADTDGGGADDLAEIADGTNAIDDPTDDIVLTGYIRLRIKNTKAEPDNIISDLGYLNIRAFFPDEELHNKVLSVTENIDSSYYEIAVRSQDEHTIKVGNISGYVDNTKIESVTASATLEGGALQTMRMEMGYKIIVKDAEESPILDATVTAGEDTVCEYLAEAATEGTYGCLLEINEDPLALPYDYSVEYEGYDTIKSAFLETRTDQADPAVIAEATLIETIILAPLDTDEDGILDEDELSEDNGYITDPLLADTDGDLLNDYDEIFTYFTDPTDSDSDDDDLSDSDEVLIYLTDPLDADTDDGGVDDGKEVIVDLEEDATDPLDPEDDVIEVVIDEKEKNDILERDCNDPFLDTREGDGEGRWYTDTVCTLYKWGIIRGRDRLHYVPEDEVTRAEILKMLLLNAGFSEFSGYDVPQSYIDVNPGDWYYNYIGLAKEEGLLENELYVYPNDNATREDMVTWAYDLYEWDDDFELDPDVCDDIDEDDDSYEAWAAMTNTEVYYDDDFTNIITGFEDETCRPNAFTNRAEAAAFIVRLYIAQGFSESLE